MGILMESADVNLGSGYRKPEVFAMSGPSEYYASSLHSIAINAREIAYERVEPIALKTYKHYQTGHPVNYFPPQPVVPSYAAAPRAPVALELVKPTAPSYAPNTVTVASPAKVEVKENSRVQPPPKKKWLNEYLEEPKSPLPVRVVVAPRSNGVALRGASPPAPAPAAPAPPPHDAPPAPFLDFTQEHSRPRAGSNGHGPPQIPSPPSVGSSGSGSSGSAPRAGTREVHNKLEKNRRAHLKECFELLKRQLPATPDDKKTSNLSILGSAIRYIQVLRRKERECEHEMERLAREKIAAQQRLAALKREVTVLAAPANGIETVVEEKPRDDRVNGQVLGIPISMTSSSPPARLEPSPPRSLNLSTKLRTLPIQITPTSSQVVRASYGARHSTLTLTALAPADAAPATQSFVFQNGSHEARGALVHPAQIHLPLSQVVHSGGLVVGGALQLVSTQQGLRVVHAPHLNGVSQSDSNRIARENGIVSTPPCTVSESNGNVVVSGLTSLPAGHLIHSHTLTHKMVETQMVKASVAPLTVSAQYLSATAIVKPVVVVSGAATPPHTSA
ncbi:max-binding protein MNT isoform X2 [Plutella xylostella]|uniref:max-binding protein MNT isoform X2 n=1 Tax=Plutella xylostella TaxID=51655 RepID=UPI0020330CB7|nr:max-binding protein MNT isoform X2 [Plutella xylostella]